MRGIIRKLLRIQRLGWQWLRDQLFETYAGGADRFAPLWPRGFDTLRLSADESVVLRAAAERFLSHTFDILGSGWRSWHCESSHLGRLNAANRATATRLAEPLGQDYRPIDWHADKRAAYHFPADRWSRLIQPGPRPGVDIKVPWELARMHHLVQLALLAVDETTQPDLAEACAAEIGDEIRDFVVSNPPRFGVNWRVAMDVAIRAANWILAASILDAHGRDTATLRELLGGSLRDHGRYIVAHLEWDPHWRGNHYLANVCGLVFIGAALPADDESNAWLAFGAGEVLAEGMRQVNEDGSGFEGSTAYHRLSLDMLVNTVALLLGIDARRWRSLRDGVRLPRGLPSGFAAVETDWHSLLDADGRLQPPQPLVERLWRAAGFTRAVTRPDGRALLIGDNDSGRFFKPCPRYEVIDARDVYTRFPDRSVEPDAGDELRELGEDHRHLVHAIEVLFGACGDENIDVQLIRWLAGGRSLHVPPTDKGAEHGFGVSAAPAQPARCNSLELSFPRPLDTAQIELHAYPGWGLYLLKGDGLLLSFRCGSLGLSGTGNHDHNDQLALTLHLDGRDWIGDPGTFRYTADIAERDAYRSVKAHFAPRLRDTDAEPGSMDLGTWRLGDQAQAAIEAVGPRHLQGRHQGYGVPVHRRVELHSDRLEVIDWAEGDLDLLPLEEQFRRLDVLGCAIPFCPDYGVRHA